MNHMLISQFPTWMKQSSSVRLGTSITASALSFVSRRIRDARCRARSQMRSSFLIPVIILLMTFHVEAQGTRARVDVSKLGPQVGQQVLDFSLNDQTGRVRNLQSIMGPRGAMLVFLRSADW